MIDRVVVLAGGFATRLRPLSYTRPKPLFPILDKPLIDWILERARDVAPAVISARYLAHMIREHISRRWGGAATVVEESRPMGDGGALAHVAESLNISGAVMVVNGDVFTDADYRAVLDAHKRAGGVATMMLVEVSPESVSKYGIAVLDDSMRLIEFVEKPKEPPAGSRLANAGIYVFEPEVFKLIPRRRGEVKIAKDIIPELLRRGDIYAFIHRGIWHDIGTPADYLKANYAALDKWGSKEVDKPGIDITPPVYIGEGSIVEEGASLGPYVVLGQGAKVGRYARLKNSVLMRAATVEPGAYISGSIIGEETYIGRWARVLESVVADGVYIKDEVYVGRGSAIGPNREVVEDVPDGSMLP